MPTEFDFSEHGGAPGGWRLARLDMANWGTFTGQRVHSLTPECGWALLTGENGSGKTTVVDALRTLLVPRRLVRFSFNTGGGGQKKHDRSLVSYIRGAWSASRDEGSAETATQYLRKEGEPSFLLSVFRNKRSRAAVTVAQILWIANGKDEAHFLIANGEKTIADLQVQGTGRELVKKLRECGWQVCEGKSYRTEFCERMGIPGDGALQIFNQAIGVKEVGDVNTFLRDHLLAPGEAEDVIRERVVPQFANLDDCWNQIEKAERQIEMLSSIATAHARAVEAENARAELRELLEALPLFYLRKQETLLTTHFAACERNVESLGSQITEVERKRDIEQQRRDTLRAQLDADKTGQRIREIEVEIQSLELSAKQRRDNHEQLSALVDAQAIGPMPIDDATFAGLCERTESKVAKLRETRDLANERANKAGVEKEKIESGVIAAQRDIDMLKQRRALIPTELQDLRDALCGDTRVAEEELPFAGELMEVKPEEYKDWAGAIERLLHGFGISLLVPERHYRIVAKWVNERHLGRRLFFHRVGVTPVSQRTDDPRAVVRRLNFRDELPLAAWVAAEVRRAFPHVCCRDTAELEGEPFGLTAQGLIRGGTRHVKDDRSRLHDRTNFVLGWSPEAKIRALEEERDRLTQLLVDVRKTESDCRANAREADQAVSALTLIGELSGFADIDFQSESDAIGRLTKEKADLEAADDRRKELKKQFDAAERALNKLSESRDDLRTEKTKHELLRDNASGKLKTVRDELAKSPEQDFTELAERFAAAEAETAWRGGDVSHENIEKFADALKASLTGRSSSFSQRINSAREEMIEPMTNFLRDYPDETKNLQPKPEYGPDFVQLHDRLRDENLPALKERFRDFLNDNLTQSIALLESKLHEERQVHEARVARVNAALEKLEYSPGTFVALDQRYTRDVQVKNFRGQLRDCLSTGLKREDEHSRKALYFKIRDLVERFKNDSEWTAHVADTRRWLDFGIPEKRRSDGAQVNYFESSIGKSTGQKAKLAFTILAASLLAQYGLADDSDRPDSLRLVAVDEVFAHTDEPNSRRALNLFKSMGFQLIVIVPWEAKARVAESYVDSFHLTVNPNGDSSELQAATRERYDAVRQPNANAA
ncbi:MAG: hypothetical protein V7609_2378 [Verrucomicrobiota bacterium]